ncbi:AfsR/SARP family transcriptional regulator [Streptomyces sp. NRRL B-3229]|uniref:AfsR/SARP family transcriptional regulator n=1 Tax=Streptomyces sp. NRRL B-3229 TaxID=1463836 RepID=UPI001F3728D5|nr:AfsR/SARP family transcriptional regulator [Streptomyces sp. NRRL B-3229]
MLATLILADGHAVSDDHLSTMLWAWDPPATMSAQLYTYVSRLRKRLGSDVELTRRSRGYQLSIHQVTLDIEEFQRHARNGRAALAQGRHDQAARELRAALDLVRGPALSNVTEFLADAERPRLEEMRLAALEDWIEAELALGRHHRLVPDLTSLTAEHPMRERLRAQLMTALYRCDRQVDALAVFRSGRRILADELGIDPGETLTAVHQAVLEGTLPRVVPARIEAAPRASVPAMLPADLPDFTGRRAELAWLRARLEPGAGDRTRQAFVTGMAGVGKSALALRAAHALRDRFPDGRLYADLTRPDGEPRDPAGILRSFLRALAIGPGAGEDTLDELVRLYRTHSAGRRILVVLDNATGHGQLSALLPTSPEAAVLVTGRRHPPGASGHDTAVLAPFTDEEATRLLATVAGPERIATEADAAREIVRSCAGLPLAVRIAAVQLAARPHWRVARLAARLADPWSRLDELTYDSLDVRESLARSLREVSARSREALPALAVFGTREFVTEAAARRLRTSEISAEQTLEELADARLLEPAERGRTGRPAYRLHELVLLTALPPRVELPALPHTDPWRGLTGALTLRPAG